MDGSNSGHAGAAYSVLDSGVGVFSCHGSHCSSDVGEFTLGEYAGEVPGETDGGQGYEDEDHGRDSTQHENSKAPGLGDEVPGQGGGAEEE